ncbi:hypothetical protein ACFPU0_06615 [Pseudomonas sp. GCM10022186]|uniref:hypothetical protein n=1 Tax=Pseudomonas sp. GCM10022186 TaxID=3252650 RepID=UPI00362341FA
MSLVTEQDKAIRLVHACGMTFSFSDLALAETFAAKLEKRVSASRPLVEETVRHRAGMLRGSWRSESQCPAAGHELHRTNSQQRYKQSVRWRGPLERSCYVFATILCWPAIYFSDAVSARSDTWSIQPAICM